MVKLPIDINCDMGESLGSEIIGQDEKLMPLITSCNIACGYHGGDDFHTPNTINLALQHNVRIGAHPSYPDLEGFGRRPMHVEKAELKNIITTQVLALKKMVEAAGGMLSYVKPHGALYNKASVDKSEAFVIIDAIKSIDSKLALMGLAGSEMEKAAAEVKIQFIAESFCDRKYIKGGLLMARNKQGAVLTKVDEVVAQVQSIVYNKSISIDNDEKLSLNADSVCIHGDNPMALQFLEGIHRMLMATK